MWLLKTVVFMLWCLIRVVLLVELQLVNNVMVMSVGKTSNVTVTTKLGERVREIDFQLFDQLTFYQMA
jgi:hypothetical protein